MMMSKILINNFAMQGLSPAKVLEQTNDMICRNNDEEMFVTVWLGVMEISTGKITAASAGHEYPIINRTSDSGFEIFKDKHGFVIGGIEGMKYEEYEFQLEKAAHFSCTQMVLSKPPTSATNCSVQKDCCLH
ncbi:MAG: serine/threonine-protein phosphatase [Ruminococcus sp.]|nr:serine/threonine-protein phosphatase [Ruminococcus sp.]